MHRFSRDKDDSFDETEHGQSFSGYGEKRQGGWCKDLAEPKTTLVTRRNKALVETVNIDKGDGAHILAETKTTLVTRQDRALAQMVNKEDGEKDLEETKTTLVTRHNTLFTLLMQ